MNFIAKTLNKLFKNANQQELNKIKPIVAKINDLEKDFLKFSAGDFVVFPKGLKCRWRVIKPVRKHYTFG